MIITSNKTAQNKIRQKLIYTNTATFLLSVLLPSVQTEEVELTSESVNRDSERVGPDCFELLTVLGKGAYGKVCVCEIVHRGLHTGILYIHI